MWTPHIRELWSSDELQMDFPVSCCTDPVHGEVPSPSHTAVAVILCNKQNHVSSDRLRRYLGHNTHQCAVQAIMGIPAYTLAAATHAKTQASQALM